MNLQKTLALALALIVASCGDDKGTNLPAPLPEEEIPQEALVATRITAITFDGQSINLDFELLSQHSDAVVDIILSHSADGHTFVPFGDEPRLTGFEASADQWTPHTLELSPDPLPVGQRIGAEFEGVWGPLVG